MSKGYEQNPNFRRFQEVSRKEHLDKKSGFSYSKIGKFLSLDAGDTELVGTLDLLVGVQILPGENCQVLK
jgi:hypothetical protein